MKILVTGGAGYIGSVMVRQLLNAGYDVVVYDDLSNGNEDVIDNRANFVRADLADRDELGKLFSQHEINAVIHFAGVISASESVENPGKYFTINTFNTINLLETMRSVDVSRIIFSSTAGVYGNPQSVPITEGHPMNPASPYGQSKAMIEQVLKWYDEAYGIKSISLRYFNAAGASIDGSLGERHKDESHIIPLAMKAIIEKTQFTLYGIDYNTKDGTCIRDYIHVEDLCSAHLVVLEYLMSKNESNVFNVGTGKGYSNMEVVQMIEKISGSSITINKTHRRDGDPELLIADATKIKNELNWKPKHFDLQTIIKTAWEFHTKNGFGS